MSQQQTRATAAPSTRDGLRAGSIGTTGIVFMVVAATAPLTALASNLSLSLGSPAGVTTLGAIILVALLMWLFSVGYVSLSKDTSNAAASYAFVSLGLGRTTGAATAAGATVTYTLASGAMMCSSGYFLSLGLHMLAGVSIPWWALSALVWGAVAALGYADIGESRRVAVIIGCAEFAILGALAVAVAVRRPQGFTPDHALPDTFDVNGLAVALVYVTLCFGGFEAAAVYSEEAGSRRDVGRAVRRCLALLTGVYFIATWAVVAAFPDVHEAAQEPGTLVSRAASAFLGSWAGSLVGAMTAVSFTAAAITYHQTASRYLFAMGREGIFPRSWSRLNARRVPARAVTVQLACAAAVIALPALTGLDPLADLFPAVAGITSLALSTGFALLSLGAVVASLRGRLTDISRWRTVVAPGAAFTGFTVVAVLVIAHYDEVVGSDALAARVSPAVLLIASGYGVYAARRRTDRR
ncbi:APC family permease [Streptomyces sp. cg28]|uniref:APC family permease n=1 Tax=Streptomyces sp. cg28 TaxID=3403457 RepID=UPI003B220BFF